ncbi:unnamed protein product, partial [Sphacelaria rigidula]
NDSSPSSTLRISTAVSIAGLPVAVKKEGDAKATNSMNISSSEDIPMADGSSPKHAALKACSSESSNQGARVTTHSTTSVGTPGVRDKGDDNRKHNPHTGDQQATKKAQEEHMEVENVHGPLSGGSRGA